MADPRVIGDGAGIADIGPTSSKAFWSEGVVSSGSVISSERLIEELGYDRSPTFLRAGQVEFNTSPAVGHIFRRAARSCGLQGVYTLQPPQRASTEPLIPVMYVCRAASDSEADETHRLVWNQDIVPFLLVTTPTSIRLYSGFHHKRPVNGQHQGMLRALRDTNDVLQIAESIDAEAIDSGKIWRRWGEAVRPDTRIDWKLLTNLRVLDDWLQKDGLSQAVSHALIGKYVYLHYLRDRGILSARKLEGWNLDSHKIFGRDATLKEVGLVTGKLDEWLNGSIFPLRFRGRNAPTQDQLRRVAATFSGDEPAESSWQLHLDFQAYDFSYIPIETLSIVYQQFLHADSPGETASRGREAGAYYTPIPIVNFMLAEIEDRKELTAGTRVLDPSCGSGAFLVQCYRRLIEREYPPDAPAPAPSKLRDLLEKHIFGIDRDHDACSVTEMSLLLTLLDYVNPPDLESNKRFKLPSLRGKNILCQDFFAESESCSPPFEGQCFEWVVGNPPWKHLTPGRLSQSDRPAWRWMMKNADAGTPISRNQIAQAFAWEVARFLEAGGVAAILLPAIVLFEDGSQDFRAKFFQRFRVHSVANFTNLVEVLFAGRSRVPAAALFYSNSNTESSPHDTVSVFSPFVANQEHTRPAVEGRRSETWSLVLNQSEIRRVSSGSILSGSSRPWKLALWGSHLDGKLLDRMERRYPQFADAEDSGVIVLSEGLQLRKRATKGQDSVVALPELCDQQELDITKMKGLRNLFAFPPRAISRVASDRCFVRERGGVELPLSICRPPHVIVSAARTFAIFSNDFIVVPPRQIGIISPEGNCDLLKAIAVYLNSDFAIYQQFLTSAELGITRSRATLRSLREMPFPFESLSQDDFHEWVEIHDSLVALTRQAIERDYSLDFSLFSEGPLREPLAEATSRLNAVVNQALGLNDRERALVRDLVHVRLELNKGGLGKVAIAPPSNCQLLKYATRLKADLDAFLGGSLDKAHEVAILVDDRSALVSVGLVYADECAETHIISADDAASDLLQGAREKLRREHCQWVYFDRDLRVLDGRQVYLLKPMQRFHWTESQAMLDAGEIIADTLTAADAMA